jgi:hypothetical protein
LAQCCAPAQQNQPENHSKAAHFAVLNGENARSGLTIDAMIVAIFVMRLLEVMFFVGLAGAAVVVLISFVEDFKELLGEE